MKLDKLTFSTKSLLVLTFISGGCVSLAHNKFACDTAATSAGPVKYPYVFAGNVTMIDECSPFKNFRVELGGYYAARKERIDNEVREDKGNKPGWPTEIYDFGRALDCKEDRLKQFNLVILKNKDEIFGKGFENSARQVTLTIKKIIKEDGILKKACD